MPYPVDDALPHAMSGTELSRVRTELRLKAGKRRARARPRKSLGKLRSKGHTRLVVAPGPLSRRNR